MATFSGQNSFRTSEIIGSIGRIIEEIGSAGFKKILMLIGILFLDLSDDKKEMVLTAIKKTNENCFNLLGLTVQFIKSEVDTVFTNGEDYWTIMDGKYCSVIINEPEV